MAIGFVKSATRPNVIRGYVQPQPPRVGDVVEGTHVEGFEVFGRIETIRGGSYMVRTDDGRLIDMRPPTCKLRLVERCTVKDYRSTYEAIGAVSNAERLRRGY